MSAAQFELAWPSPLLSPESKAGSAQRAAISANARKAAFHAARRSAPLAVSPCGGGVDLELVFIPPNLRRYSLQSLLQRMGPTLDGLADYLGIDRDELSARARISRAPTPGGSVLVKLKTGVYSETKHNFA